MTARVDSSWLLLIHQIPAVPAYLRIKIGRRLARVGALALKGSVYALPVSDSCREDFAWIRREIVDGGGEAMVFESRAVEGIADAELQQMFRDARTKDYVALGAELDGVAGQARAENGRERQAALGEVARVEQRFGEIQRIDFFDVAASSALRARIEVLKQTLAQHGKLPTASPRSPYRTADHQGRTWVTRTGVKADRMACAWLIGRCIDKNPKFRFVDPARHTPRKGELRFDMSEGEFTHEGELCTFEVLCRRFGVQAAEILRLGEVIHDLDIKDGRYAHAETEGVRKMLDGIVAQRTRDDQRIEAASALFDALVAAPPRQSKRSKA